jgi:hypothetical protein
MPTRGGSIYQIVKDASPFDEFGFGEAAKARLPSDGIFVIHAVG